MQAMPANHADLLARIAHFFDENSPGEAIELINASKFDSADVRNASGVALMRTGRAAEAVALYRRLVTNETGLTLRADRPTVYKSNYATALALAGNVSGAVTVLNEINEESHPGVMRLRKSIERWRKSLSFMQRFWLAVAGTNPKRPVEIFGPPGDLAPLAPRRPTSTAA